MAERKIAEAFDFHTEVQNQLNVGLTKLRPNRALAAAFRNIPDPITPFIHSQGLNFGQRLLRPAGGASPSRHIPRLSHKVWITSSIDPHMPTAEHLYTYQQTIERMPPDWAHFFWTNNLSIGAQIQKRLQAAGCSITVADVSSFSSNVLYDHAEKFIAANKFVCAADLFKMMILDHMGGLYSDLGANVTPRAVEMFSYADAGLAVCSNNLLFQMVCIALPPKSMLAAAFTGIAAVPESFDAAVSRANGRPTGLDEISPCGGPNLTLSSVLFSPSENTWIIPSQGAAMSVFSYGSWFGREKETFGNIDLVHAKATIMRQDMVEHYRSVARENLTVYGDIGLLRIQLELLIKLVPHYEKHPTELCKLFAVYGSDKATGRHNYSILYNFLFGRYVGRSPSLLEIGTSVNNPDEPSPADVTCGSLRAWRKFFVNGEVIGAEADGNALLSETGIQSYGVDKTKPVAIAALLAQLPKLDLIIDDGHCFDASRNVVELALPQLADGGMMVIEDVPRHEKKRWDVYLSQSKLNAAIVDLPHQKNDQNNRLIFILPQREFPD